jgi:hypothetical protein
MATLKDTVLVCLYAEKHKEVIKAYAPKDGTFSIETRFTLDEKKYYKK